MATGSKLIRGGDLAAGCTPWQAPEVTGIPARTGGMQEQRSAQQQANQQAFEQGRAAGLEAGAREIAARAQALERALDALAKPFEQLDHQFQEQILALVTAVARQLVRREMRIDPTHIVGVIREGLAALPMSAGDVVVRLHPEDARVVRECLTPGPDSRRWRIEPDPLMERGGCIIATPSSQVDGRLETRLGRAIATLFEDERKSDDEPPINTPG